MDPLEMGGNIAKSIPGVQGAMQGANWMNQNVVDPASAQLKQLMAAIAQLMGGGGQPVGQPGQPGPGGIQGGGFGGGVMSGLRGAMIGGGGPQSLGTPQQDPQFQGGRGSGRPVGIVAGNLPQFDPNDPYGFERTGAGRPPKRPGVRDY